MLRELGIVVGKVTKAGKIFESLFPKFLEIKYTRPSEYVDICWNKYKSSSNLNSNLNGKIFEYILATLCIREKILPLYLSSKVAFVPNVIYDLMFYTKERGPICWSVKTSLRERYKQADLESIVLKNVHREALCYLITLEEYEASRVRNKINRGDIIGLDDVIVATSKEFDELVKKLKEYIFEEPPTVNVVESNQIITIDKVNSILK
jgi:hypothetical protein